MQLWLLPFEKNLCLNKILQKLLPYLYLLRHVESNSNLSKVLTQRQLLMTNKLRKMTFLLLSGIEFCNKILDSNLALEASNGNWRVVCFWLGFAFIWSFGKDFIQVARYHYKTVLLKRPDLFTVVQNRGAPTFGAGYFTKWWFSQGGFFIVLVYLLVHSFFNCKIPLGSKTHRLTNKKIWIWLKNIAPVSSTVYS